MEKIHKTELFDEKILEASLKYLHSYNPAKFSSDILLVGCCSKVK